MGRSQIPTDREEKVVEWAVIWVEDLVQIWMGEDQNEVLALFEVDKFEYDE